MELRRGSKQRQIYRIKVVEDEEEECCIGLQKSLGRQQVYYFDCERESRTTRENKQPGRITELKLSPSHYKTVLPTTPSSNHKKGVKCYN